MRFEREGAALPLVAADVERTRRPLEQATQLPRAAFADPAVLDWEQEHLFRGGWVCAGHVDQVRERGDFLMVEVGADSVFVVADDDGLPARVPQRLPAPRRAARRAARGPHAPPAVPLPRVDLRLRRLASQRAVHRRASRTSTPPATGSSPCASRSSRGSCCSTCPARRRRPQEHVGDLAPLLARYRLRRAAARRAASSTTSAPTGRRSPRTTASACTAPACIPSSTGSRTTCRARRRRRGRVVRRVDDARRRLRDDGGRRRRTGERRSRASTRPALGPLLRPVPEHAGLAAPGLRDAAHAVAARGRPHRGRLRVVLRGARRSTRRASTRTTRSSSGTRSTARTGTCASSRSSGHGVERATSPAATPPRRATCTSSTSMVAERYLELR